MTGRAYWDEKMATISADALEALETEALKKQLAYVYEKSPFYKKKFDDAGVHPDDFQERDDI